MSGASSSHTAGSSYKKEALLAYAVLLPIFLYHFFIIIFPSFNTVISSFTNWSGIGPREWAGLSNYLELVRDPDFHGALKNNFKWMSVFLTIPIILGIVVGYLLSGIKKGSTFFRAIYFLPYVISAAIAGKIFGAFYNPYFGVNLVLENLGLDFLVREWLAPAHALISVALVDNWHWWGFVLVLFISALQQIDPMLYESAEVEGAGGLRKIWHITIPCIKPTLIFIVLITMVWSIGTFEYVWVMTKGGPGTEILSTMLYKNALLKYRAGYASAISVVQTLFSFALFGIFGLIRKRMED